MLKEAKRAIVIGIAISIVSIILIVAIIISSVAMQLLALNKSKDNDIDMSLFNLPACITEDIIRAAVLSYEKYGVPASITIAQILVESGTEFSELATRDKNLFGVKFFGNGIEGEDFNYWKTREENSHGSYYIRAKFRKYKSYAESIDAHGELLAQPMYKSRVKDLKSPDAWADALQGKYATAHNYASTLKKIMQQYNLYQFDGVKSKNLKSLGNVNYIGAAKKSSSAQAAIVTAALSSPDPFNHGYRNLCEGWVCDTYRKAGLHYSASCCASHARERFAIKTGKIPIGAVIYSSKGYKSGVRCSCGRDAGHVAIYIGDGKVAGSQTPYIMDINDWIALCGYGGYSFNDNNIKVKN